MIRKKWEEVIKTQQQKLSEVFLHLSLQVYHHNLLSQMFRYSFQWVVLSPRPPLLSFGWYECDGVKSLLLLLPLSILEATLGIPHLEFCVNPSLRAEAGKKTKFLYSKLSSDHGGLFFFVGKTAALLCKSQPSPETWVSLSHNLSATID